MGTIRAADHFLINVESENTFPSVLSNFSQLIGFSRFSIIFFSQYGVEGEVRQSLRPTRTVHWLFKKPLASSRPCFRLVEIVQNSFTTLYDSHRLEETLPYMFNILSYSLRLAKIINH